MIKTYHVKLKDNDDNDVILEVRDDFATLAAVERACDKGILKILEELSSGSFRFSQIATLLHAALVANGNSKRTESEVGQLIMNVGFMDTLRQQLDEFICALAVPRMGAVASGKGKREQENSLGKK